MKIIIYTLTGIAFLTTLTFIILAYRNQQNIVTTPETITIPTVIESETDVAKRILLSQLDTSNMTTDEKSRAEASALQQIDDDAKLYKIAIAAGTEVSSSSFFFAWQRELYNHTDEAGLTAHIASLGLTEEQYRALVLQRLTTATFMETKAAARVSEADVREYYDALPTDERDDFEMMEPEIRENLIAQQVPIVRQELLSQ